MKHIPFQLTESIPAPSRNPEHADRTSADLAGGAIVAVWELVARAADGETAALEFLVGICKHGTDALNGLPKDRLRPIARKSPQWPAVASLNPENTRAVDVLLRTIQLGAESEIACHGRTNWRRDDVMTAVALDLIEAIRRNKELLPVIEKPPRWVKAAAKLKTLSKGTAKDWSTVAKAALLEAIPRPETDSLFRGIGANEKEPSRRRAKIMERLAAAIRAIAGTVPEKSRRTR